MKIVIINGSARKGNTLTAINAFIKGASEKNEIEIIEPDKLNIAPCKGCGVLYKFFPIHSSSFMESLFFSSSSLAVA